MVTKNQVQYILSTSCFPYSYLLLLTENIRVFRSEEKWR